MFKKILKGIVIGGAAFTIAASAAQAEQIDVNLYGASAQFKFWTSAAPDFLKFKGCADADNFAATNKIEEGNGTHDRDSGIAVCVGDVAVEGMTGAGIAGDTVIMRYTTNSSYDGPRSVTADPAYDPDGCGPANRLQADVTGADLQPYGAAAGTSIPTLSCQDVHIGASDVAATTFNQTSEGELKGHAGGGYETRSVIFPDDVPDPEALGYNVYRPIVVPFSFFANDDLSNGGANAVPFDNLTRLQAVSLFNGQVMHWNEFIDGTETGLEAVICLRHAGSGTAATLDAAVMRGDYPLVTKQVTTTDRAYTRGISPVIWFNKGSSDEMRCVGENIGAVGYADVDKCPLSGGTDKCTDVKRISYQGVHGSNASVRFGQYDFWAAQWLYSLETGKTETLIEDLALFASDEANLPSSKAPYWASQDAMVWEKATDFAFPKKK